mgnify:CR=1 FL=1
MDIENKEEQQVEESGYEDVCFVCHRPESKAGKMIHLTKDICICSECMQKTMDMMSKGNVDYSKMDFSKMPNISMINLSDLQNMIPKRQKVKRKAAEEAVRKLSHEIRNVLEAKTDKYEWFRYFKEYQNISGLNRMAAVELIDRVRVFDKNHVEIDFNFRDCFQSALRQIQSAGCTGCTEENGRVIIQEREVV